MTDARSWMSLRRPAPPGDLATSLEVGDGDGASVVEALTIAGTSRLERARAHPGRVRESAFRLLEADALITYACEAALERDDPETALRSILASVGR